MKKKNLSVFISIAILIFISTWSIVNAPSNLTNELKNCYYVLWINLFITIIMMQIFALKNKDIFNPIYLFSIIHILMFEVTPLICILNGNIYFFNIYVWRGCIKGTILSTLAYIMVYLGYFIKFNNQKITKENDNNIHITDKKRKQILYTSYCMWIIGFICSIILIKGYGLNIKYILTAGSSVMENSVNTKSIYGFLVMFTYMMIPSYLYIFEFGKNKIIKIILFYLMFMSYFVRGFRFVMIAAITSVIFFWYIKNKKRPSLKKIIIIISILAIFSNYIQVTRGSIRSGEGGNISIQKLVDHESIEEMLIGNFEIVKTYYAIVEKIPNKFSYTHGQEIIAYTMTMMIPRFIWKNKPEPIIYEVITNVINYQARIAGTSYPYIGEYYFEFGILGIIIFCLILGMCLKLLNNSLKSDNINNIILFASILPLLLQIMIRGYTPTNFYLIVFVIIPIQILRKIYIGEGKGI